MDADAVRRLDRALARAWGSGGRRFVTVEDAGDERRFVQYIDGQLNVAWPFEDDPGDVLQERGVTLPDSAFVVSWRPDATALLAVGDVLRDDMADLIEDIVDLVLEIDDVTVRVEDDR